MKNKKIISSLLIISMMMCLLPMKMFMATEPDPQTVSLKIIPTKINSTDVTLNDQGVPTTTPTAHPGDTITYTIKMGPVANFGGIQLQLDIPEGLTFVSGQLVDEINSTLITNSENIDVGNTGLVFADFNNDTKRIIIYGCDYTEQTDTTDLATFTCSVDQNAEGEKSVTFVDSANEHMITAKDATQIPEDISDLDSTVTITAAPQYKIGDVNGDGRVNTTDAQLALNIYTGKLKYDPTLDPTDPSYISEDLFNEYKQRADVNKDNKVNTTDAQTILNIYSGRLIEVDGQLVPNGN